MNILGEIYFAEIGTVHRHGIPSWGTFHMKERSVGGPFCDIGVHIIDEFYGWYEIRNQSQLVA